jgi:hypothetical protein
MRTSTGRSRFPPGQSKPFDLSSGLFGVGLLELELECELELFVSLGSLEEGRGLVSMLWSWTEVSAWSIGSLVVDMMSE